MNRLTISALAVLSLTFPACRLPDRSDTTDGDGNTAAGHTVTGSSVEFYETDSDLSGLYARVALAMDGPQLAELQRLVAGGNVSGAVLGYVQPSDTAALSRLLSGSAVRDAIGHDIRLMWGKITEHYGNTDVLPLYALKLSAGMPAMHGHIVSHASLEKAPDEGYCQIMLRLTPEASERFAHITRENIGRQIAVAIGGKVVMAPYVQSEITGGNIAVSMPSSTEKECRDLIDSL